jgi:uncharacterized protein (TIGR02271 family)
LPVVEEQVRIGKRSTVGRGNVRAYTHVTERPIEEHLRLREERITVERRPVDRRSPGSPPNAFEEQTIELTETAEEPVIEKQARVVEEVAVSKEVREREDTVRETARRTEVTVDRPDRDFSTVESESRQHCTKAFRRRWSLLRGECSPAYRYGYELGGRARGDWTAAEAEEFKESIRYAWTGRVPSRLMRRSGGRALALSPGPTPGKEYREILADRRAFPALPITAGYGFRTGPCAPASDRDPARPSSTTS